MVNKDKSFINARLLIDDMPKGVNIPKTTVLSMKKQDSLGFIWVPYNNGKTKVHWTLAAEAAAHTGN